MNINCRIAELQCKEVINICDGARLGYISDVEVDICTGKLVSIIVPGRWSLFALFTRCEEYVICWEQIEKIGDDIVLVKFDASSCDVRGRECRNKKEKRKRYWI